MLVDKCLEAFAGNGLNLVFEEGGPAQQFSFKSESLAGPIPKIKSIGMLNNFAAAEYKIGVDAVYNGVAGKRKAVGGHPIGGAAGIVGLNVGESELHIFTGIHQHMPHSFGFVALQARKSVIAECDVIGVAVLHAFKIFVRESGIELLNELFVTVHDVCSDVGINIVKMNLGECDDVIISQCDNGMKGLS